MSEASYDFDPAFQRKIAALLLRDSNFAGKAADLVVPEYFTETAVSTLARIALDHVRVYKAVPDPSTLKVLITDALTAKRIKPTDLPDIRAVLGDIYKTSLSNPKFVADKVVDFARHQAMEAAIMKSVGFLEKAQFDKIQEAMKQALAVGSFEDGEDYDYYGEIDNRTQVREDLKAGKIKRNGIPTGYSEIDALLYHHGWGRKELSCLMGAAKAGKSMALGDFAKNATLAGYHVYYDSLEVSKEIIAERIDANLSEVMVRELHKNPSFVQAAIKAAASSAGVFKLRDHPSGTLKPSALNRQLEKYRADGIIFDLVVVDYADIMAAEYRSDSLQENLRSIYIDLRAIGHEQNVAMLTATQTNREGAKAFTAKATDVGDDWNKARTVDVMIGINASEEEKKAGEARLTWLLSRNTEDGLTMTIKQDRSRMQFVKKVLSITK